MFQAFSPKTQIASACFLQSRAALPVSHSRQQARLARLKQVALRSRSILRVLAASISAQGPADSSDVSKSKAVGSKTAAPSAQANGSEKRKTSSDPQRPPLSDQTTPLGLKRYHYATFFSILVAGIAFLAVLLYLQADIEIQQACYKVVRRLLKTVALRQVRMHNPTILLLLSVLPNLER